MSWPEALVTIVVTLCATLLLIAALAVYAGKKGFAKVKDWVDEEEKDERLKKGLR